ncbi:hypothetical protein ACTA71_000021 [Dictyostelium dimigraforme]
MTFIDNFEFNSNTPRLVRGPFIILNSIIFSLSFILLCSTGIIIYYLNDYYLVKDLTLPLGSFIISAYMVIASIVGGISIWKKKLGLHLTFMVFLVVLIFCLVGVSAKMIVDSHHPEKLQHKIEKIWYRVGDYQHHSKHYQNGIIEIIEKHHRCCGWSKEIEGNYCVHFNRRGSGHGYCAPYVEKSVESILKYLGYYGIVLSVIELILLILSGFFLLKTNKNVKSKSFILKN